MAEIVPGGLSSRMPAPRTAPNAPGYPGRRVRVLIVDDEASICRAFSLALRLVGYETTVAETGELAIEIVRAEHIDVLLVDLRIPGIRGDVVFNVAASVQPHLAHQTLFMTGDITEQAQKLIAACGCPYLQKPFDLAAMFDAIAALTPHAETGVG